MEGGHIADKSRGAAWPDEHNASSLQETKTAEIDASAKEEKKDEAASLNAEAKEADQAEAIEEDEEKYPSRSPMVGGWAGGEIGLKQFVEVSTFIQMRLP